MKRGYMMASRCCMCMADLETIDHLFLHCGVAREIWFVFRAFGIQWVLPHRVMELLLDGGIGWGGVRHVCGTWSS
jgi:hypothetical protein